LMLFPFCPVLACFFPSGAFFFFLFFFSVLWLNLPDFKASTLLPPPPTRRFLVALLSLLLTALQQWLHSFIFFGFAGGWVCVQSECVLYLLVMTPMKRTGSFFSDFSERPLTLLFPFFALHDRLFFLPRVLKGVLSELLLLVWLPFPFRLRFVFMSCTDFFSSFSYLLHYYLFFLSFEMEC